MWKVKCGAEALTDVETGEVLDHHERMFAANTIVSHVNTTGCANAHNSYDDGKNCTNPEGCAIAYIKEDGQVIPGTAVWAHEETVLPQSD